MSNKQLPFDQSEYEDRLARTRRAMERAEIELLIITDPSNMAWLTGYDGWSFYVHQCVLVTSDDPPLWFGRSIDANGARRTIYMGRDRIFTYPDHFVQSPDRHPMDVLSALINEQGWSKRRIGVELDNYYFSAACHLSLRRNLPNASFKDATGLVNWERAIKSERELGYMRIAGRIVESMHRRIFEIVEPGMPKNQIVAEIYRAGIMGTDGVGGDYPSIVPLIPSGADAGAPHLTWDDAPIRADEGIYFEIAGCYRRYHCPLARTIFLGKPPPKFHKAEQALIEGLAAGLEAARPGGTCESIARAFFGVLTRYGIKKDDRCGYAIGLSYPPDWGERTMSIRLGDTTELRPNMTFHFMPGLWFDDWGIEITESIVITDDGARSLANVPRRLLVKD